MKPFKDYYSQAYKTKQFPTLEKRVQLFRKRGTDDYRIKEIWTTDRVTFHKTMKAAKTAYNK